MLLNSHQRTQESDCLALMSQDREAFSLEGQSSPSKVFPEWMMASLDNLHALKSRSILACTQDTPAGLKVA
jgi:hypothetical protein